MAKDWLALTAFRTLSFKEHSRYKGTGALKSDGKLIGRVLVSSTGEEVSVFTDTPDMMTRWKSPEDLARELFLDAGEDFGLIVEGDYPFRMTYRNGNWSALNAETMTPRQLGYIRYLWKSINERRHWNSREENDTQLDAWCLETVHAPASELTTRQASTVINKLSGQLEWVLVNVRGLKEGDPSIKKLIRAQKAEEETE